MSTDGLIAAIIIVAVTLLFVFTPLFNRRNRSAVDDRQRDRLLVNYERILTNIRDLDEDFSTAKIPQADYESERETWVQRGIEVLKALDSLEPHEKAVASSLDPDMDRQVEEAIAAYRARAKS